MRQTVQQLIPAIGQDVMVRFESIVVACKVVDAKNSWGKVRVQIVPMSGTGTQWIELERIQATDWSHVEAVIARSQAGR